MNNDTEVSDYFSLEDDTLDTADESRPSPMGIFIVNFEFDICSLDDGTRSDDKIMPTLQYSDWYKEGTYSYDDDDSDFFNYNSQHYLISSFMETKEFFSVVRHIMTQ